MASAPPAGWQRPLLTAGCLVAVAAALWWARAVIVPVVLAILLTFILSPLVTALQALRIGRAPAVLLTVLLAAGAVASTGTLVAAQFQRLAHELPRHKDEIVLKVRSIRAANEDSWLAKLQQTIQEVSTEVRPEEAPAPNGGAVPVVLRDSELEMIQSLLGPTVEVVVSTGLVILLVAFMLLHREDLRNRLIRLWAGRNLASMTRAIDDAGKRISRFLLMQLLINSSYGLATGVGLLLLGIPYALLWGFLAGLLRYIPYLGPWLGALFPILFSIAVVPGWTEPMLAVALFIVLELVSNNVMEPLLYGHSIGVSEVALIVSAAFWTWLWGPIGLVLATPLTACLAVMGRYFPNLEFLAVLLSDRPALQTHQTFYQRVLADDEDEAATILDEYRRQHCIEDLLDQVFLPALIHASHAFEQGELSHAEVESMARSFRALLEDQDREGTAPLAAPLVLGCPARRDLDELALALLERLLEGKCRFELLPASTLAAEVVARVRESMPVLVCVAAVAPAGVRQVSYLCKRLRAQFPGLRILAACWGCNDPGVVERLRAAGADAVATSSLVESRRQVLPFLSLSDNGAAGGPRIGSPRAEPATPALTRGDAEPEA